MKFAIFFYCVLLKIVACKQNAIGKSTNTKSTDYPSSTPQSAKASQMGLDNNKIQKDDLKIVLDYKPTRPSFLPVPSTVPQLISSGKPWPASPEEYNTSSTTTLSLQLVDRFPELTSTAAVTKITITTESTGIVLGYKPQRPWYLPETDTLKPIIPPGTPWPANARLSIKLPTDEVQRDKAI